MCPPSRSASFLGVFLAMAHVLAVGAHAAEATPERITLPYWSYPVPQLGSVASESPNLGTGCEMRWTWPPYEKAPATHAAARYCREGLLEGARAAGDTRTEALALAELAVLELGSEAERERWIERALEVAKGGGDRCVVAFVLRMRQQMERMLSVMDETLAEAVEWARGGCDAQLASALYERGIHRVGERGDTGLELLKEAVSLARRHDYAFVYVHGLESIAYELAERGDPHALDLRREILDYHRSRGQAQEEARATWNVGVAHVHLGDFASAVPLLERYLQWERDNGRNSFLDREVEYLAAVRRGFRR